MGLLIVVLINRSFCYRLSYFLFFHHSIIVLLFFFFAHTRKSSSLVVGFGVYSLWGFLFLALIRSSPFYFPYLRCMLVVQVFISQASFY